MAMRSCARGGGSGGGAVTKKKGRVLLGQPGLPFTSTPNPVPTRKPQEICIPGQDLQVLQLIS